MLVTMHDQLRRLVVAVAMSGLMLGIASAIPAYSPRQQLSAQEISDYSKNLLGQSLARITALTRDLVASDPATLDTIVQLAKGATKDQKAAIAAGLAQAARLYVRIDQTFAASIQQKVAETKDQDLIVAYTFATGDLPIGGLGGGAAGSGGSSGGQTGALAGPLGFAGAIQGINGGSVDTGNFSASGSVTGAGGIFGSSTTSNNSSSSVSP